MGESFRYHPPEVEKPAPLSNENRFERVEQDKSPEVKKDTKYEPTPADAGIKDTTTPPETSAPKPISKTGMSAMQGDAPADVPAPPVGAPSDTGQDNS